MEVAGREVVNRNSGPLTKGERVVARVEAEESPAIVSLPRWSIALIQAVVTVGEDEVGAMAWACLFLFSLLSANYLIRPVRDEMGISGGTAHLPALFAATLAAMLVLWLLLGARRARRPRRPSFMLVGRVIQLSLVCFFVAFQVLPSRELAWTARLFFVWASVANLLVVSIAWGSLAGQFTSDQAHRLFGMIAAGGTLGAIAGSALAGLLVVAAGPAALLLLATGFLELALLAGRRLLHSSGVENSQPGAAESPRHARRLFLMGLGLWTLLFTTSSAFIYMEQARIVHASIAESAGRTAFFARIDLLVNVLGLLSQVFLTSTVLALLGVGGAAAMLPAVTLAGAVVLYLQPTINTVLWFQIVRRAVDYAIARPSREVFYTVIARSEMLRAKGFIDMAVYRAGDAVGAWAYGLLASLPILSASTQLAIVPLSAVWFLLSLGLGRAMDAQRADQGSGCGKGF